MSKSYIVPDNIFFQELEDELFILSFNSSEYFGLEGVGKKIWELINDGHTEEETLLELAKLYPDIASETLTTDLRELIDSFCNFGLLVESNKTAETA
ncbi:MAG: PqqD family protein [Gammaproteobacteria bacterium]|nr:PqqD family protein [Gammaproteobacteria bacterium]